ISSRHQAPPAQAAFADLWLGECDERLGNHDQALLAYRRALENRPEWPLARQHLAGCLAALGKSDDAITEYRKLVDEVPEVRGDLARLLIARNRQLPPLQQNWTEVEGLVAKLPVGRTEGGADVLLLRAQGLVARGKLAEARKLIEAERDRDPTQV